MNEANRISKDTIYRQDAIDALSVGKKALSRMLLDEIDVVGTDREKCSWGLKLIEASIKDIEELPPAQPELIRCKDCHYYFNTHCHFPPTFGRYVEETHYCGYAERRSDG